MENQSNDYVQIRFESSKVLDAKDQADHDTRTKNPSYIRDEHKHNQESNTIYVWTETDEIQTFELMTRKKEQDRSVRNEVNKILHKQLDAEVKKVKDECKNFRPNKHAIVVNGVITLSPSLIEKYDKNELDKETINQHFIEALDKVSKELNLKIMNASIHYDEKVPHLHFNVRNYYNGKGISLDLKKSYSKAQDIVGSVFENIGYRRGEKKKTHGRVKDHLSVTNMHKKEIETLSSRVANKKNIAEELEQNIQQLSAKHQAMNADMNYYKTNKSNLDKELQNLKTEYQAFKNSDKMKQIDTYKKLKFSTEKLQSYVKELAVIKQKEIEEIKQMRSEKEELSVDVIKNTDVVEEEGFFLKKQIHAPAGYTFIKSDDFKKLKITAMTIKKIEAENNCSIQDIAQNLRVKNELEVSHKKELDSLHNRYKNEMYTIELQAKKVIENIKKQAQEELDEKIYEMQCIIDKQADNLKSFSDKIGNMLHTLKVKFGLNESDLNSDDVKLTKNTTNDKSSNFPNK